MPQRKTLTSRQIDVLRWIGDRCPGGVMTDPARPERITAAALRSRGLITTKGRGVAWSATITQAGVEYLASVDGPNPPIPRSPNRPASQQLIDDLLAAGGELRVPSRYGHAGPGRPDYERRAALAAGTGRVPPGKWLRISHDGGELVIELVDVPDGTPTHPGPVPVAGRVSRLHPVVAGFRANDSRHEVSRSQLARACRILHAVATEAERRGYGVEGHRRNKVDAHRGPLWSGDRDGHLRIQVHDHWITLRVHEAGVRSRKLYRERTPHDPITGHAVRRSWEHEQGATGRLVLSILAPSSRYERTSHWSDTSKASLEGLLPQALMEVECRAAEETERARLEAQKQERRRQDWETAIRHAKAQFVDEHRAETLRQQVARWQEAAAIRSFCDQVEATHRTSPAALAWSSWARAHADRIDPLNAELAPPAPPDPIDPDQLRPFLKGWNPYSPYPCERYSGHLRR